MSVRVSCSYCSFSTSITRGNTRSKGHSEVDQGHKKQRRALMLKCHTCETIDAVIENLRTLVVRYPFLETEGRAHIEIMAAWEYGEDLVKPAPSDEYTTSMRKEDGLLRTKLLNMGLGDVEGMENIWEGEGFGRTPDDKNGKCKMPNESRGNRKTKELKNLCFKTEEKKDFNFQRSERQLKSW